MSPAGCAAYAAPSTPEVSEPLAALPTPAEVRSSFAKQSGSEGSRASQSVWELAGEHFNHVARALGTAQPGRVCSALPQLPGPGERGVISASFTKGWCPQRGLPGAGALAQLALLPTRAGSAPHKLPDPPRGPLDRHFHAPAKRSREVAAPRLLAVPASSRGANLQAGEGGRPPASPQSHPAGLAVPRGVSTAATDGQPGCASGMKIKSIKLQPFQQGM